MTKILIPSTSPEDWSQFLAEPDKQWKAGYSARSLAYCWQEAGGIPTDVLAVLRQVPSFKKLKTIFAIPEHKVSLPGGSRASQNDVWVLAETPDSLVSIAVEGKVSEPFGPTIEEWIEVETPGKKKRLNYLLKELGFNDARIPVKARYQLLHRSVSAIIEARRFRTKEAVMVVHSFSQTHEWLDDYLYFLSLFGLVGGVGKASTVAISDSINFTFAWVQGNEKYLKS